MKLSYRKPWLVMLTDKTTWKGTVIAQMAERAAAEDLLADLTLPDSVVGEVLPVWQVDTDPDTLTHPIEMPDPNEPLEDDDSDDDGGIILGDAPPPWECQPAA